MKRNAKVVAKTDLERMEVTIRFKTGPYRLVTSEVNNLVTIAANSVADAIRNLPYVNFGPNNTVVSAPKG